MTPIPPIPVADPAACVSAMVCPTRGGPTRGGGAPSAPPAAPVTALAFSPDGKTLAVGTFRAVQLWDFASGRRRRTLSGPSDAVHALAFSPDGKTLAIGSGVPTRDGQTLLVDVASGKTVRTLGRHTDPVYALAWLDRGARLVTASGDRTLRLWKTATGACLHVLKDHADAVYGVAVTADGKRLVSTGVDRSIKVWDARSGRALFTFLGRAHADTAYTLQFSPDGGRLLSAGGDRVARMWLLGPDQDTTRAFRTLAEHAGAVHAAAFSPDGLYVATASADRTVGLWNGPGGGFLAPLRGAQDWIYTVAFAPDSRHVVAGTYDGAVLEWEVRSGRLLRSFSTAAGATVAVAAAQEPPKEPPKPPEPVKVADGLLSPDGPAYDGKGMVFVGNRDADYVTRIDAGGARTQQFRRDPNQFTFEKTGGQTYFEDGSLFACDFVRKAIVRIYVDQRQELYADKCEDAGFQGPRDLAFDPAGSLYVTDSGGALFRVAAGNRIVRRVADGLASPTGLAFSADARTLFVAEAATGTVWRYPVQADGTLAARTPFHRFAADQTPGGLALDVAGNLYAAVKGGVAVLAPDGAVVRTIAFPGTVTNIEFGAKELKTLYATVVVPAEGGTPARGELWKVQVDPGGLPLFRAPKNDVK